MRTRMWIAGLMLFFAVATAAAQDGGDEEYVGRTPPRLGYVNGQVSFLRPGAEDWSRPRPIRPCRRVTSSTRARSARSNCRSVPAPLSAAGVTRTSGW